MDFCHAKETEKKVNWWWTVVSVTQEEEGIPSDLYVHWGVKRLSNGSPTSSLLKFIPPPEPKSVHHKYGKSKTLSGPLDTKNKNTKENEIQ